MFQKTRARLASSSSSTSCVFCRGPFTSCTLHQVFSVSSCLLSSRSCLSNQSIGILKIYNQKGKKSLLSVPSIQNTVWARKMFPTVFMQCFPFAGLLCLFRKDPHGFFAFPVTDAIAPGYSMIIKHPMDFSTMKDKIAMNEYKTVTEFKVFGVFFFFLI